MGQGKQGAARGYEPIEAARLQHSDNVGPEIGVLKVEPARVPLNRKVRQKSGANLKACFNEKGNGLCGGQDLF